MALLAKVGTFQIGTGAIGTTYAVTGVGFQPKVVIFWLGKDTTVPSTSSAESGFTIGAMASATQRASACHSMGVGATQFVHAANRSDACIATNSGGAGAIDALADFSSFDADGFTVVVDDVFPAARQVHYLALGGTDLLNVAVGQTVLGFGTTTQNVTGLGFDPDLVIGFQAYGSGGIGLGFSNGTLRRGAGFFAQSGQSTTNTWAILEDDMVVPTYTSAGGADKGCSNITMGTGQFTVTATQAAGALNLGYVALELTNHDISTITAQTSTGNFNKTGLSFRPSALFLLATEGETAVLTAVSNGARLAVGAASAATERAAYSVGSADAQSGASNTRTRMDNAHLMSVLNDAVPAAIAWEQELVSFNSDGWTLNQTDAAPTADIIFALAFGPGAAGGGTPTDLELESEVEVGDTFDMRVAKLLAILQDTEVGGEDTALRVAKLLAMTSEVQVGDTLELRVARLLGLLSEVQVGAYMNLRAAGDLALLSDTEVGGAEIALHVGKPLALLQNIQVASDMVLRVARNLEIVQNTQVGTLIDLLVAKRLAVLQDTEVGALLQLRVAVALALLQDTEVGDSLALHVRKWLAILQNTQVSGYIALQTDDLAAGMALEWDVLVRKTVEMTVAAPVIEWDVMVRKTIEIDTEIPHA